MQYLLLKAPEQPQPEPGIDRDLFSHAVQREQCYRDSGRLEGGRTLITAPDPGIGRAAVIAIARERADVAFNDLRLEQPGEVAAASVCMASQESSYVSCVMLSVTGRSLAQ